MLALAWFMVAALHAGQHLSSMVLAVASGVALLVVGWLAHFDRTEDFRVVAVVVLNLATFAAIVLDAQRSAAVVLLPSVLLLSILLSEGRSRTVWTVIGVLQSVVALLVFNPATEPSVVVAHLPTIYATAAVSVLVCWHVGKAFRSGLLQQEQRQRDLVAEQEIKTYLAELARNRTRQFAITSATGIWECDHNYRLCYLSSRGRDALGVEARDPLDRRLTDVLLDHGIDQELAMAMQRLMSSQQSFRNVRLEFRDRSERKNTLICSGLAQLDGRGDFRGFRGIIIDRTREALIPHGPRPSDARDALTGVLTREIWLARVEQECADSDNDHARLTVALLDLDDFGLINQRGGLPVGDSLLRQVAAILTDVIGLGGTLGRIDGDVFGWLLLEEADVVARQAREILTQIRCLRLPSGETFEQLTASCLVVPGNRLHAAPDHDWLAQSQRQLDKMKRAGGDRMMIHWP